MKLFIWTIKIFIHIFLFSLLFSFLTKRFGKKETELTKKIKYISATVLSLITVTMLDKLHRYLDTIPPKFIILLTIWSGKMLMHIWIFSVFFVFLTKIFRIFEKNKTKDIRRIAVFASIVLNFILSTIISGKFSFLRLTIATYCGAIFYYLYVFKYKTPASE